MLFRRILFWISLMLTTALCIGIEIYQEHNYSSVWITLSSNWSVVNEELSVHFPHTGKYVSTVLCYPASAAQTYWYPDFKMEIKNNRASAFNTLAQLPSRDYVVDVNRDEELKVIKVTYVKSERVERELGLADQISKCGKIQLRFKFQNIPEYFRLSLYGFCAFFALSFAGLIVAIVIRLNDHVESHSGGIQS